MFKIKINPLWNKSVLLITFSFLIILSSYVLTYPNESEKSLKSIYDFFAINFELYFLIIGFIILLILNHQVSKILHNSSIFNDIRAFPRFPQMSLRYTKQK